MTLFRFLMTSSVIMTSSKKLWCHFVPYLLENISAKFHWYCITISKVMKGGPNQPPLGSWELKKARSTTPHINVETSSKLSLFPPAPPSQCCYKSVVAGLVLSSRFATIQHWVGGRGTLNIAFFILVSIIYVEGCLYFLEDLVISWWKNFFWKWPSSSRSPGSCMFIVCAFSSCSS